MTQKILLSLFVIVFCTVNINAQAPAIQWQKSLGGTGQDFGNDVKATSDGGCIIVGETFSFNGDVTGNHGNNDGWIVKLDANGDIEWERSVGGSSSDWLRGVALTSDGGYIAIGNTQSDDGDVTGYHGGPFGSINIWVIKLDSTGSIEWNNCYGGTGNDNSAGTIALTSDGGYIFSGTTNSSDGDVTGFHLGTDPFVNDIWVVKINSVGVLQWQKCLGGSKNEISEDFRETSDNGYIVSGSTWGSYDGDVIGNTDTVSGMSVWIVKLDSAQSIVWQKTYGGTGMEDPTGSLITEYGGYTFLALTQSLDGDVIGFHGSKDFWLVHIDSSGIIQWQVCYGGDSSLINSGSLVKTQKGGYAMTGEYFVEDSDFPSYHVDPLNTLSTDYVVVETDSLRNPVFQHCYGSYLIDSPGAIAFAADGGLIIAGSSGGNNGDVSGHHGPLATEDVWVLKLGQLAVGVHNQVKPLHAFKVYPNPVSASAKIAFYLPVSNQITVRIYDLSGKEIKTLLNENLSSGFQQLNWDCNSNDQQPVLNGIFIVKITAGAYTTHTKITVIR